MARIFSIYEAKAKLSELLRLVKAGQEVVITERGKPLAKIVLFEDETLSLKGRLETLKREGSLQMRTLRGKFEKAKKTAAGGLKRFLDERD